MKNRIKKPLTASISRDQVEAIVNDLACAVLNRRRLETEINERKLAIDAEFAARLAPYDEAIEGMTSTLQAWAEGHPDEFAKRKSIEFASGTIGFRTGTPKLALLNRSWNWEKALEAVKQFLPNFIRDMPEIDKPAIIGQAKELEYILPKCGVKVTQAESFFVDPNITEAEARQVGKAEAKRK